MARFASLADMQVRFEERDLVQLTDEVGTGAIDAARVDKALASSDQLIIGYIAARYKLVSQFEGHELLRDIACDYAFALLWRSDLPDWAQARRKDAIARLGDIAKGVIKLDEGEEQAEARPGAILIDGPERRFSRQSLDGY